MKKFTKMTAEQFVEAMQAEESRRRKEKERAKGSGSHPSIKRYKRRHR